MSVYAKQRQTHRYRKQIAVTNEKKEGESDKLGVPDIQTTFKQRSNKDAVQQGELYPLLCNNL